MLTRYLGLAASLALATFAGAALGQSAADNQRILDRAKASARWITEFSCPSLGLPPSAKGLESSGQVAAAIQSNWEFANSRVQAIRSVLVTREQVARNLTTLKSRPSESMIRELQSIDDEIQLVVARVGSALTTWALANWIEMAQIEPGFPYPGAGAHPLSTYVDRGAALRALVQQFERLPGGSDFVVPIRSKYQHCLVVAQNQVLERNSDSLYAAIAAAETSASADAISRPYGVANASFLADGVPLPDVIKAQRERSATLRAEEQRRAEEEARRRAEADRLAREARAADAAKHSSIHPFPSAGGAGGGASNQQGLRVAVAMVDALSSGSVSEALSYMHDDVVMSSPAGQHHGKQKVGSTLQQGFSSGKGASVGTPYLGTGGQVTADVRSQRGSGRMIFEFQGNLVSRIRVVR